VDMASAQAAYQDNPQVLAEAYGQIADKYGDGILRDIAGNPTAVDRLMKARDRYFQNVSKLDAQNTKAEDEKTRTHEYKENTESQISIRERKEQVEEAHQKAQEAATQQRIALEKQRIEIERKRAAKGAGPNPYTMDGSGGGEEKEEGDTGDGGEEPIAEPPSVSEPPGDGEVTQDEGPPLEKPPPSPQARPPTSAAPQPQAAAQRPPVKPATQVAARGAKPPDKQVAAAGAPTTDAEIEQDAGPPLAPGTEPDDKTAWQMGPAMHHLNPTGRGIALYSLMNPSAYQKIVEGANGAPLIAAQMELQGQMDDILGKAESGELSGPETVKAIRNIYRPLGGTLQNVIDAKRPIPGGGGMGGGGAAMSPFWSMMGDLAIAAKPGWNPNNFENSKKFADPNGRTQVQLKRAGTMAKTAVNIMKDLNAIKDDPKSFIARMTELIRSKHIEGRPEYTNLYNDWQAFVQEDQFVRAGAPAVTETEEQIKTVFTQWAPGTKAQIRDAVIHNIGTAAEAIRINRNLWNQYGVASNGKPDRMYGGDPDADEAIAAFDRVDRDTGQLKGPVPKMWEGAVPQDKPGFSIEEVKP
ncbi:MAG TPA: hypothetical protein VF742_02215, partial [Terracidiphilus sp.]